VVLLLFYSRIFSAYIGGFEMLRISNADRLPLNQVICRLSSAVGRDAAISLLQFSSPTSCGQRSHLNSSNARCYRNLRRFCMLDSIVQSNTLK
jgi:hypothetical protein